MIDVGAVVLNYNTPELTLNLVKDLQSQQNINLYIVIVDNCSTDESFHILKSRLSGTENLEVIRTAENLGYARGNNAGLEFLTAYQPEFSVILNPDVSLSDPLLLFGLTGFYKDHKDAGIIAPLMLTDKGTPGALSSWRFPTLWDDLVSFSRTLGWIRQRIKKQDSPKGILEVDCLAGSFLFCKSETLKRVDFFDPATFLYNEETILCFKIKELNFRNYLIGDRHYHHQCESSINKTFSVYRKYVCLYESKLYFRRRYEKKYFIGFLVLTAGLLINMVENAFLILFKKTLSGDKA
jgi:GT2 family glycosyltransferase